MKKAAYGIAVIILALATPSSTQARTLTPTSDEALRPGDRAAYVAPDPDLGGQQWFRALHLGAAWDIATGKGIRIAACSPGYYFREPEIKRNLDYEYRRDLSDKDNTIAIDDGKFVSNGTAATAIMVAARDGVGTSGIAFDASVIPLQNYNYDPELDDTDKEEATAACIHHAIYLNRADMIVLFNQTSNGSSETFRGTRDAISRAINQGLVVVASAGDNSKELLIEGEIDTGSIIVGALRQNGSAANFSNYGHRVTVSAVGEGVYTLGGPDGRMRYFGGTAAATAQVAAVVALALQANPRLSPTQIRALLVQTRYLASNNMAVGGQIDAEAFIKKAAATRGHNLIKNRFANFHEMLKRQLRP